MRKYRSLLLILLLGIVPTFALLVSAYLYFGQDDPPPSVTVQAPPPPEPDDPPPVEVLAVARTLTIGTLITANDVAYVPLQPEAVFSSHLRRDQTEPSAVIGSVTRIALIENTPLTWSALVRPGQDGFLAAALMPNHRAVTIVVNQATSHAGLIAPGDRVDVVFTMEVPGDNSRLNAFSRTILENIRVVAVGRRVESVATEVEPEESESGRRNGGNTVTLEVLPSEADQLVLATTRGSVSLALRPLSRAGRFGRRPPTGLTTLLPPPATERPDPKPVRVQVFRGDSRQEVLLTK